MLKKIKRTVIRFTYLKFKDFECKEGFLKNLCTYAKLYDICMICVCDRKTMKWNVLNRINTNTDNNNNNNNNNLMICETFTLKTIEDFCWVVCNEINQSQEQYFDHELKMLLAKMPDKSLRDLLFFESRWQA